MAFGCVPVRSPHFMIGYVVVGHQESPVSFPNATQLVISIPITDTRCWIPLQKSFLPKLSARGNNASGFNMFHARIHNHRPYGQTFRQYNNTAVKTFLCPATPVPSVKVSYTVSDPKDRGDANRTNLEFV